MATPAAGLGGPALLVDETGTAYGAENPLPVSGAPGGEATIADGADIAQGAVADAAVAAGAAGKVSAKLRRVTTQLAAIETLLTSILAVLTDVHDVENASIKTTEVSP